LLYELLTGTTPFNAETFRTAAYDEIRRIIREQEPPRPSTRVSTLEATAATVSANRQSDPRSLGKLMRGELDWIVMKALEKDRRRRYETANDFAADVRRYLDDEPVAACPPSAWYRFGKLARRKRGVLSTAALVALALVAGTAVSVWQAMRAREAAAEARQRAEESRQVVEYLATDIFDGIPGRKGSRSVTIGELLDHADATLGERFREQPLIEASIRLVLAGVYGGVSENGRAERNAARAVQIRERYLGPEHPATLEALVAQAMCLHEVLLHKSRTPELMVRRVLAVRRRVLGPAHPDTLEVQHTLAGFVNEQGRHEEAEEMLRRVLAVHRRDLGPAHLESLRVQRDLAGFVNEQGRHEEAEELAAQAEALALRFFGPEHGATIDARFFLGMIARSRGNLDRAEALLRQVASWSERHRGPLDNDYYHSIRMLADLLREEGRLQEARRLYFEMVDRRGRMYGLTHILSSGPLYGLIAVLRQQGDYAALRDLCEGWIRELLAMPPEVGKYERDRHSLRLGRFALTLATLPEPISFDGELAVRAAEQAAAQGNGRHDNNWTRLSLVHLRLGHIERAEWAVRESMKRRNGDDCFDSMTLALIHARRGELAEARAWFDRAAREKGRDNRPPGIDSKEVRDKVAALLGLADLPADVFARP
jgi:tetratricopeptide (TPR) repeat protein